MTKWAVQCAQCGALTFPADQRAEEERRAVSDPLTIPVVEEQSSAHQNAAGQAEKPVARQSRYLGTVEGEASAQTTGSAVTPAPAAPEAPSEAPGAALARKTLQSYAEVDAEHPESAHIKTDEELHAREVLRLQAENDYLNAEHQAFEATQQALKAAEEENQNAHAALDTFNVARGAGGHSIRYRIGLLVEDAQERLLDCARACYPQFRHANGVLADNVLRAVKLYVEEHETKVAALKDDIIEALRQRNDLQADIDALRSDIERHVAIAAAYVQDPTATQLSEAADALTAAKTELQAWVTTYVDRKPDDDTSAVLRIIDAALSRLKGKAS